MGRWTRVLGGVLLLCLALVALAAWQAGPLIAWAVPLGAAWAGVGPLDLRVTGVATSRLVIEDLVIGDPASPGVTARRVVVRASPAQLWQGRLGRVTVTEPRVRVHWDGQRAVISGLGDLLDGSDGDSGGGQAAAMPIDTLVVRNAEAAVTGPWGTATALFDADAAPAPEGGLAATVFAVAEHGLGWVRGTASLALGGDGSVSGDVVVAEAEAAAPGVALHIGEGWLRGSLPVGAAPSLTVDLNVTRLAVGGRGITGLRLSGGVSDNALDVSLGGRALIPGASAEARVRSSDITAPDSPVTATARLDLRDAARDPAGSALPFGAVLDGTARIDVTATVGALLSGDWTDGEALRPRADLDLTVAADLPDGPAAASIVGGVEAVVSAARVEVAAAPDLTLNLSAGVPEGAATGPARLSLRPMDTDRPILSVTKDWAEPGLTLGVSAAFEAALDADGAIAGTVAGEAVLDGDGRPRSVRLGGLRASGGPVAWRGYRLRTIDLTAEGGGTPDDAAATVRIDAILDAVELDGLRIREPSLSGTVRMAWFDGMLQATPDGCFGLGAAGFTWQGTIVRGGSVAACAAAGDGPLATLRPGDGLLDSVTVDGRLNLREPLSVVHADGPNRVGGRLTRLVLSVVGDATGLDGRIDAAVEGVAADTPGLRLDGGRIAAVGRLAIGPERVSFSPDNCLQIAISGLQAGDVMTLTQPLETCVSATAGPLLDARIGPAAMVRFAGSLAETEAAARLGAADGGLAFSADLPAVDATASWRSGDAAWSAAATVTGGEVRSADGRWAATGFETQLAASGRGTIDAGSVDIAGVRLEDRAEPPAVAPIVVVATADAAAGRATFTLSAGDDDGVFDLSAEGRHDFVTGAGDVTFAVPSLVFGPDRQPQQVLPVLRGIVSSVRGRLDVGGSASWADGNLNSELTVNLEDGAVNTVVAQVTGIDARAEFDSIWPPSTPPGQTLSIASADVGLPIEDVSAAFRVLPEGVVLVERATWPWSGGLIEANDVRLTPGQPRQDFVLDVSGVEVSALLTLIDLEGLEGTGALGGRIPVAVIDGTPHIQDGRLSAGPEGGTIRYLSDATDAALRSGGTGGALLADALKDFRYTGMVMEMNGATTGQVDARVQLAGFNPDLYDGYPIELNMSFEGDLGQMMRGVTAGSSVPDDIRRRIEGRP